MGSYGMNGRCWRIVLKKSKMPPQQNSRKSELMADFGLRCPLRVFEKATGRIRPREAVPPRSKTPSASAALRKSVPTLERTFSTQSAQSGRLQKCRKRTKLALRRRQAETIPHRVLMRGCCIYRAKVAAVMQGGAQNELRYFRSKFPPGRSFFSASL